MSRWIAPDRASSRLSRPDSGASSRTTLRKVKSIDSSFGALFGVRNTFRNREYIDSPYRQSGWVHACLKPIGQAVAQVPLRFWTANPDEDKKARVLAKTDHPIPSLFAKPNALMTMARFFEAGAIHRKLDGTDYWVAFGPTGQPIEASDDLKIPVPVSMMAFRGRAGAPVNDTFGMPVAFRFSTYGGNSITVSPDAVFQFSDYNPDNPASGLSDIESALSDIDLDWQTQRYQRSIVENSGDPGGFIEIDGQLGQEEEKALQKEVDQKFRVDQAGRNRVITGKNVKYTPNKLTPRDMEFRQLQEFVRDKIASITGVPLPIIGVLTRATFANFSQAVEMFWTGGNGVIAYLRSVEDVINHMFLPRIRDAAVQRGMIARFDISGIKALQEDKQLQLEKAKGIAAAGVGISMDEALQLVGLQTDVSKMPFSGVRLVSAGMVPIEHALNPPDPAPATPPAADPAKPADEPAKAATITKSEEPAPVVDAPDPGFEERSAYWHERNSKVLLSGIVRVKAKYKRWRRKYEAAQIERIREFADKGEASLRAATVLVTKDDPPPPPRIDAVDVERLLLYQNEWAQKMSEALGTTVQDIFKAALDDIATELDVVPMGMEDARVLAFLQSQMIQLTEGHTSVLAEKVREALLTGLEKAGGTNIGELQQLVAAALPEIEAELKGTFADRDSRALMIARTETGHASNGARFMEMQYEGITKHEWVSSRDQAVRGAPGGPYADSKFSHFELEGRIVIVGTLFDGAKHPHLKYPCDPQAEAGDVISCRCLSRPVRNSDEGNP